MTLQEKLTELRKQKGLTQLDLAEQLHVSRQAISRWEVGAAVPSTDNLKVLSELYGVSVDYLLNDNSKAVSEETASQTQEPVRQPYRGRTLLAAVAGAVISVAILTAIFVVMFMAVMLRSQQPRAVPMEDMETVMEDNYPTETFVAGWG